MPKRPLIIAASVAAAIILFGCASGGAAADGPEKSQVSQTAATDGAEPAAEESSAAPADTSPATIGTGVGYTWENNVQVQVLSVTRFKIGQYAAGGKPGDVGAKVKVKVTNKSPETVELGLARVILKAGPNGEECDTVFDSDNNVAGGFEGSVAPGRSATTSYGFAIPRALLPMVNVEFTPAYEYSPAIFEGKIA